MKAKSLSKTVQGTTIVFTQNNKSVTWEIVAGAPDSPQAKARTIELIAKKCGPVEVTVYPGTNLVTIPGATIERR